MSFLHSFAGGCLRHVAFVPGVTLVTASCCLLATVGVAKRKIGSV